MVTSAGFLFSVGIRPVPSLDLKIPPPFLFLVIAIAMGVASQFTPRAAFDPNVRVPAAFVLVAAGLACGALALLKFRAADTTPDPIKIDAASTLVTDGIYAYSRNPMYLGLTIMLIGWAVFLAAPYAGIGAAAFVIYLTQYQILPEERMLTRKFGGSYRAYQAKVRRWL